MFLDPNFFWTQIFFSVWCPNPHPNFCAFVTLGSILDSKRSINLAQLVSLSVALLAELVQPNVQPNI